MKAHQQHQQRPMVTATTTTSEASQLLLDKQQQQPHARTPYISNELVVTACAWLVGAGVQSIIFLTFNAVDVFNFFFGDYLNAEVYLGLTVGAANMVGAVLVLTRGANTRPTVAQWHMLAGFMMSIMCIVVAFVFVPMVDDSPMDMSPRAVFALVSFLIGAGGFCQSVTGGIFYAFIGSHLTGRESQVAQSGGVAGFALSFAVRVATKAAVPADGASERSGFAKSAYMYVGVMSLLIVASSVAALVLCRIVRASARPGPRAAAVDNSVNSSMQLSDDNIPTDYRALLRDHWRALLTVSMTLILANSVYPGLASQLHDGSTGWFMVVLFGAYACGDWLGKVLPGIVMLYNERTVVRSLVIQAILCFVVIMIAVFKHNSFLQSDAFAYVALSLLGINTGYGICCGMVLLAPSSDGGQRDRSSGDEFVHGDYTKLTVKSVSNSSSGTYSASDKTTASFAALQFGVMCGMLCGIGIAAACA